MAATQSSEALRGIVKQVLSGDAVIIRGPLKANGCAERQLNFSNVTAPRLARRNVSSQTESKDEPYAWESREFLRKKVIGKHVIFFIDPKTKAQPRQYGTLFLAAADGSAGENIIESMVSEGLLSVRKDQGGNSNLSQLEDQAKSQGKGKYSGDDKQAIRNIKWIVDNPRSLVDRLGGKQVPAIIEHVRDGSTVKAFLINNNDFTHVTLMIAGIRCPNVSQESASNWGKPGTPEYFAAEAKFFLESRLLQKDIHVVLETSNNNNVVGSIIHPNGNIAEYLLKEGLAKCVDWSMTTVTGGPEKLRAAERFAKQKKLKLWVDYKPPTSKVSDKEREFSGKVVEVVNGDALMILKADNTQKKVFLASIRPPRLDDKEKQQSGKVFRPLFDIPWLYDAREFLRKKLIGQKVNLTVDYIQPAQNNYPEKTCCTVKINDVNVAEAMVAKGLATVVRYRQDDDQRAACYDDLLAAEAKAIKGNKGLHNKKESPNLRINDVSDPNKAKPYLPSLKRAGRVDAVPEFIASGSRMRMYVPKESSIITFLLAGISCPRASRAAPGGVGGMIEGEPFGSDAMLFTKSQVLQREVQIEVESMDKGGNFIGWLFYEGKNLSVELVSKGLSSMHATAESSPYYHSLQSAQTNARQVKANIWKNFKPEEVVQKVEDVSAERKIDYKAMVVTEITNDGKFYAQYTADGPALEKLSESLQSAFKNNPPLPGAYKPRKGEVCAAKFIDNNWYRAKVEKVSGGKAHVFYVDYGNRELAELTKCAQLPAGLGQQPFYCKEMSLALIKLHKEEDHLAQALESLRLETENELLANTEYKMSGTEFVTLQTKDNTDIGKKMLKEGIVLVDRRRDRRLQSLLAEYTEAQEEAKKKHLNIWMYGDITDDDAHEFGM